MRLLTTAIALTIALAPSAFAELQDTSSKIQFDLDRLDESGLYGAEEGKRSLSYEFCIPNRPADIEAVQRIDSTVVLYFESPGRMSCDSTEMLVIGHTQQPNYREVITKLARLESIEQIEQFWGE